MTLEEAIEHEREVARTCNDYQCAADHVQIAEWLSLLKVYTDTGMAKEVQRARHEMHEWQLEWKREIERRKELEDENAKLRKFSKSAWRVMTHNESPQAWKVMAATACKLGIEVDK